MRSIWEFLIERWISLNGMASILLVVLIFLFLLREGLSVFKFTSLKDFILGENWYPISDPPRFGILPLILGSLLVTLGALILSIPLGIGAAVFISEVAPAWIRDWLKSGVELLATIPSIVIGFIGIAVLAPWVRGLFSLPTGLTALTGSLALAFMAMPTIVSIAEDALTAVPSAYREASLALGATRWQTIYRVVVPSAASGILGAVMLGVGRAIGETMAVMMITGNAAVIPRSLLQPVRTLTATIAAEMGETVQQSPHYFALFAIGIVLFVITFLINFGAGAVLSRKEKER
ncbi:MAG: phosphate ABC transporter permease subunit PstC [bacterium]